NHSAQQTWPADWVRRVVVELAQSYAEGRRCGRAGPAVLVFCGLRLANHEHRAGRVLDDAIGGRLQQDLPLYHAHFRSDALIRASSRTRLPSAAAAAGL